jgi:signal transduction histidine kinase
MTLIPETQSLVISAAFLAGFGLIALVTLWQVRSTAVYLWCATGVAGAVYSLVSSGTVFGPLDDRPGIAAIMGVIVLASVIAKVIAIRLLAGLAPRWRRFGAVFGSLAAVLGGLLLVSGSVPLFIAVLSVVISVVGMEFVRLTYRLGREQRLGNAKLLAALMGVQAMALLLAALVILITGDNVLPSSEVMVSSFVPVGFGILAAVNNGAFIALVLDIYVKRLDSARAQALALESERSRLAERERLLADMHDGLGSQLASARIRFERGSLTTQQAGDVLQECVSDLHLLVDTLRGSGDDLGAALSDLRYRLDQRVSGTGLRLTWSIALDEAPPQPSAVVLNLLRVVQEAITNALKHSGATELRISADFAPREGIQLVVEDNGCGIPAEHPRGRGLANMQRRATEVGARLTIGARDGGGTRVSIQLPTRVA